jgi:parallel beta-helix repeat protein
MTGQADPPAGCFPGGVAANAEHGILIAGQRRVEVFGPGVIQRFRGQGVLVGAATRITLKDFTISTNCNSGVLVGGSDNDLEGLVAVGNGNRESPCGGVCISGGNFNRVRGSVFGGNGYAVTATTNFGIGLLGTARGNIIEKNTVTGNVNGIFLQPGVIETLVFNNIVSGNPPIQTPLSIESFLGFDIRNQAAEGANTFHGNSCSTYSGAGAPPCPSIISVIRR